MTRMVVRYAIVRGNTQLTKQHDIKQGKPYLQDSVTVDGGSTGKKQIMHGDLVDRSSNWNPPTHDGISGHA